MITKQKTMVNENGTAGGKNAQEKKGKKSEKEKKWEKKEENYKMKICKAGKNNKVVIVMSASPLRVWCFLPFTLQQVVFK